MKEAKELSQFEIEFDNRKILINWQKPFVGGDGKLFLALLGLLAAFCYFCTLTEDECQSTERVMRGMPITRTVKDLRARYFYLKAIADESKKGKKFIDKFPHKEREGLVYTPIVEDDRVCNPLANEATLHFHPQIFDLIKDLNYQLNSRLRTSSGLAVAQQRVEKAKKNLQKERKQCKNCKKSYVHLFSTHVNKNKACSLFYKEIREFNRLKDIEDR